MWHCPDCEFWNDEADVRCARCRHDRSEVPSGNRTAAEAASGEEPRRGRWGWVEWTSLAVIVACLLVLGIIGYTSWQRGLLDFSVIGLRPDNAAGDEGGPGKYRVDVDALEAQDHPLSLVYTAGLRALRRLRPYAAFVLEREARLGQTAEPDSWEEELSAEAIALRAEAAETAEELLAKYEEFEAYCVRYDERELQPYQQLVRNEFIAQLVEAVRMTGLVYAHDPLGQDAAYSLSDKAVVAVEQHAPEQAERLRQVWADAVYERAQFLLDIEQQEEYRQLSARLESLIELHRGFQVSLNELPAYNIRGGKLDKPGRAALDLLDTLAANIEDMVLEFTEYRETLDETSLSDGNRGLIIQIEDLCMEDHLYAFAEVYRIYAQDERLEHPAYAKLKGHLGFVLEHWPRQEMAYRRVYNQYEAEWAALWAR